MRNNHRVSKLMAAGVISCFALSGVVAHAQHEGHRHEAHQHDAQTKAPDAAIIVQQAYAFPSRPGVPNAAVYFEVVKNAGTAPDALLSVSGKVAKRIELHQMVIQAQVMRMRQLPKIDLPPGQPVDMAKGSAYHVMLLGLHEPLKAGQRFPLTLHFKAAGEQTVMVEVQESGKAGKAGKGHGGHEHGGHDHAKGHQH
ncbi:MAG: copper chaperone PCu(A)C [Lautropia sp.]|nr:copper chaperone PCu(A)C [Lautropia sp.]